MNNYKRSTLLTVSSILNIVFNGIWLILWLYIVLKVKDTFSEYIFYDEAAQMGAGFIILVGVIMFGYRIITGILGLTMHSKVGQIVLNALAVAASCLMVILLLASDSGDSAWVFLIRMILPALSIAGACTSQSQTGTYPRTGTYTAQTAYGPQNTYGQPAAYTRQTPQTPYTSQQPTAGQNPYSPQQPTAGTQNPYSTQQSATQNPYRTQQPTAGSQSPYSPQQPTAGTQNPYSTQQSATQNPYRTQQPTAGSQIPYSPQQPSAGSQTPYSQQNPYHTDHQ